MTAVWKWVIVVLVALLVVGLLAFSRGRDHQRGDEVGSPSAIASLSME